MAKPITFKDFRIDPDSVSLYKGRTGCRCGCGGGYYYSVASAKKALKVFEEQWDKTTFTQGFGDELILETRIEPYANGDRKVMALYFKLSKS